MILLQGWIICTDNKHKLCTVLGIEYDSTYQWSSATHWFRIRVAPAIQSNSTSVLMVKHAIIMVF